MSFVGWPFVVDGFGDSWLDRCMETTNHRRNLTIAITLVCLLVSLVCMAVAIVRGDREGATIIFVSVGLAANSLARMWI